MTDTRPPHATTEARPPCTTPAARPRRTTTEASGAAQDPLATPGGLAALHARCFDVPRPWSAREFSALLASPGAALITRPEGLAVGRTAAGEAELLTLAVDPARRRGGTGRALLAAFEARARGDGAREAVLEVARGNAAARALYAAAGWREVGCRPHYYADGQDALVLRKALVRPVPGGAA